MPQPKIKALIDFLSAGYKKGLAGEHAHEKLAPKGRLKPDQFANKIALAKKSAVLALFYLKEGKEYLLCIRRPKYEGTHSNQIAFAGGKCEDEDQDYLDTALRETHEEVGIYKDEIHVVGKLSSLYIPPSNFYVQPFLGVCLSENPKFKPDQREVEKLIEIELNELKNFQVTHQSITKGTIKMRMPSYLYNQHIIWGATAMMIAEIKALIDS